MSKKRALITGPYYGVEKDKTFIEKIETL